MNRVNIPRAQYRNVSEIGDHVIRSLRKGMSRVYFQHQNTGHSIGVKLSESEIRDGVAILRAAVAPVDGNQKHDESYLHEELLLSASIDDETIIEGFLNHIEHGSSTVQEYQLELVSEGKVLAFKVTPALKEQGGPRTLILNVENL